MGFLECLHVQFAVVLLASRYILWFITLKGVNIENGSKTATVWPGSSFDANVEFPAVSWVSMTTVKAGLVNIGGIRAHKSFSNFELVASFYEISPDADPLFSIVSKTWGAFIS